MEQYGADTVSLAVEMVPDRVARFALVHRCSTFSAGRRQLAQAVVEMQRTGLLALRPDELGFRGTVQVKTRSQKRAALSIESGGHSEVIPDQNTWTAPDMPARSLGGGFESALMLCRLVLAQSAPEVQQAALFD